MVRDPIKRILSHWVHATGAGYETREMVATLSQPDSSYIHRSMYWMQLQPYLERFDRAQIEIVTQEELQSEREATMRRAFAFAGVDEGFTSEQFDREWEKSSGEAGRQIPAHGEADQAARLPLLRPQLRPAARVDALDRGEGRPRPREAARRRSPSCPTTSSRPLRGRFGGGRGRAAEVRRPRVRRLEQLLLAPMQRLLPDPGPTTVERQLDRYRPWEKPGEDRPFVAVNFAATVDGRAAIGGVSGADRLPRRHRDAGGAADPIRRGDDRGRDDAGRALRAPRLPSQETRERREQLGLPHDPLMVIVSGRLDLPWDAPLFTAGGGRVLIFTASEAEPPPTATSLRIVRHEGSVDVAEALRHLRRERGIRALICEGGPGLHGELEAGGLVDDLFLTLAPKLAGGEAPRILEGVLPAVAELELAWLLEEESELFARYRRR